MKSLQALAQDWQALSALLDEALALPTEDRAAWLERLGPQAEGLRPRLRELLELQEDVRTRGFLEALPMLPGLHAPALAVQVGDQVGPYRLVDEIGRGGMGTVWLAERADGLLKRRCALKLPLLAWSDSLRERMAQERDILAGLDHPHIARLLDTGVDDQGRPFLALEHVQGEPIDAWMDARSLPVRERVALFVQVVDAIRYAHANLVIHRDLKPSNILVTAQGQAKLLDFGIAKLLSDAAAGEPSDLTMTGQRLLTPRYASPEQILGQRLTAASDVYSLGVLLHELLCGKPPYAAGKEPDRLPEQAVLEADVRAPSRQATDPEKAARRGTTPERLARQLRGELDAIVLRAMARVPQERYASAEALQADLRAWLDGRPVQARNPGALAVAWKFVRRHRWPVGIGTAGVAATVVMAVVAGWMALKTEREMRSTGAARDFLVDVLKRATPVRKEGREPTVRELLQEAEASAGARFSGQPALEAIAQKELAQLWAGFGDHARRAAALEKRSAALESMQDHGELAANLLVQAKVAVELMRDLVAAERHLDRFLTMQPRREITAELQFEHDYWRGWLEYRKGNLETSLGWFERAGKQLPARNTVYWSALVLRVRSLVELELGRWADSKRSFETLIRLVESNDQQWDESQRRSVRWELQAELHKRGEFLRGWAEVQDLVRSDSATRGAFALIGIPEQRAWLRWCLTMRQEQLALDWLRRREAFLLAQATAPAKDVEWLLLEGELYGLAGEREVSRQRFAQAEQAAGPSARGPGAGAILARLGWAEARLSLQTGDVEGAAKALAKLQSVESLQPGTHADRLRLARIEQLTGLIARARGYHANSIQPLENAARLFRDLYGSEHPELLAVEFMRAASIWQVSPSPEALDNAGRTARALLQVLPVDHPVARAAREGLNQIESWRAIGQGQASVKPPLPASPRSLIIF